MTEASTTRSPSTPCTRMLAGSTTAISSVPIFAVHDGCKAVSASAATQSRISWSVDTDGPGEISPASNGAKAGWARMWRGGGGRAEPPRAGARGGREGEEGGGGRGGGGGLVTRVHC